MESSSASAAPHQTATRAEFEEWCRMYAGLWVGDITLPVEFPGIAKQGEKVTAYGDYRFTADENALLATGYFGNGTVTSLTVYDAADRQIRYLEAYSDGVLWDVVCFKRDGRWKAKGVGSNPDGSRTEAELALTVSDGGATLERAGTITGEGGKATEFRQVFRRVGK